MMNSWFWPRNENYGVWPHFKDFRFNKADSAGHSEHSERKKEKGQTEEEREDSIEEWTGVKSFQRN